MTALLRDDEFVCAVEAATEAFEARMAALRDIQRIVEADARDTLAAARAAAHAAWLKRVTARAASGGAS